VINVLVLAILRSLNCNKLYTSSLNTHVGSGNPLSTLVTEPVSETITPEAMIQRKRDALARLTAIENMIYSAQDPLAELKDRFVLHHDILSFDIERVLSRYDAPHQPSKLFDFMDWAGTDRNHQGNFRAVVGQFQHASNDQHKRMARKLLINIAEYFVQAKARVEGTPAEDELKAKFNQVVDSVLDASRNCIDQTLNQLQTLALDVVAEGDADQQAGSIQRKLFNRTGLALCKYRTNLLQEILRRQNPNATHMVDLERAVTQRLANELGLQGGIFSGGAAYNAGVNLDAAVNNALTAFRNEYKPLELLLDDLKTYFGIHRTLRNQILSWAENHYNLSAENGNPLPDGSRAPNMDSRLSEDIATLPASEGGNLTLSAVVLLLDQTGLIQEITT
jgi:hypothetical protein